VTSLRKQLTLLSRVGKRALTLGLTGLIALAANSFAGPREQALQIHNRVAGVPPTEAVLVQMTQLIEANNVAGAVNLAMDNEAFYSVTLKNLATPWTNREQTVFAPLNDYTATIIGMVRDDKDFRTALYGNILYTVNGVSPGYSNSDNNHYIQAETQGVSLKDSLVERQQSQVNGLPAEAVSGVITSRAAARAFFIDGTNRAMFRFTLMNHLCRDMEQVHDVTRVPDFIRQDVSRSPGGDSRVFLNNCMGCHNGMDPMAKAYAYYDFEYPTDTPDAGAIHYNTTNDVHKGETQTSRVEYKYLQNGSTFKPGFVTEDSGWKNYWREGINKHLGWDQSLPGSGTGASSMNQELAHSKAFASCQVEKVFENVCLRTPASDTDLNKIEEFTSSFASSGYKLKQVFRDTATYCKGE
jgi:hypothetical protein